MTLLAASRRRCESAAGFPYKSCRQRHLGGVGQRDLSRRAARTLLREPQAPRFACTCSRGRVAAMIRGLGLQEAQSILAERGEIGVGCDFCGRQYRFEPVDAAQIFTSPGDRPPVTTAVQ